MSGSALQIDAALVMRVAKLAKINIQEKEVEKLCSSMHDILELAKQISHVQHVDISASHAEVLDIDNADEDIAIDANYSQQLSSPCFYFEDNFFKVPMFMGEE